MAEGRVAEIGVGAPGTDADGQTLQGVGAGPGLGCGPAHLLLRRPLNLRRRSLAPEARGHEVVRLRGAAAAFEAELLAVAGELEAADEPGAALAVSLITSQRAMLRDDELISRAEAAIVGQGATAEQAVLTALQALEARFGALKAPTIRAIWRDIEDVGHALIGRLGGDMGRLTIDPGDVVIAHDLTVGELISVIKAGAAGLVLESGSMTSHVAVLCRSAGLPAVLGVTGALRSVQDEVRVCVDGESGRVGLGGAAEAVADWSPRAVAAGSSPPGALFGPGGDDGSDSDGLIWRANLDLDWRSDQVGRYGAKGVGLWRTLYLYLGRDELPSEDELALAFSAVAERCAPAPVTVRLLDLSGPSDDADLPLALRGLGDCRGVRLLRHRPDVIDTQLRALLRAGRHGNLRLLLPFVSDVAEVHAIRARLERLRAEVDGPQLPLGAMVEVPALLLSLPELAEACDFLAIGSNDLGALLLGTGRERGGFERPTLPPALATAMRWTVEAGRAAGVPVSLCGELAAEPSLMGALLDLGLREFSLAPRLLPRVRAAAKAWAATAAAKGAADADAAADDGAAASPVPTSVGP